MGILSWLKKVFGGDSLASVNRNVDTCAAAPTTVVPLSAPTNDLPVDAEADRTVLEPAPDSEPVESTPTPYTPATPAAARIVAAAVDALVDELDGQLFFSKIAGVTKRNKRGPSRQRLITELEDWTELYLFPEPENRFSDCAIRIENIDGEQLGYIPDRTACEMSAQIARGRLYRCFVAEVTGWEHYTRGVNIVILNWDPVHAARPEREFERFMSNVALATGGEWFYARLIGLTKSNEDGTPRRKLFGPLEHKEQLGISTDGDTRETAKYVYLRNGAGVKLGSLALKQSAKVLDAVAEGRRWTAFYRDCTEQEAPPGFRPNIAMLCFGPEASAKAIENGGSWP